MPSIIKVAVADDQALFRECLVETMNSLQTIKVILQAENGKELLDKIAELSEKPQVILLDLDMPVMNGVETTKQLRERFPDIKIVILSIHEEEKYVTKMVQLGIHGYLAKNAKLQEVEKAIFAVHENGYYFNETLLRLFSAASSKKALSKKIPLDIDFSPRELEVLVLICREFTTSEIGEKLFISDRTAERHRKNLLAKTNSRNTAGLVIYAIKNQLFNIDNLKTTAK